jgi:hypothetical protein
MQLIIGASCPSVNGLVAFEDVSRGRADVSVAIGPGLPGRLLTGRHDVGRRKPRHANASTTRALRILDRRGVTQLRGGYLVGPGAAEPIFPPGVEPRTPRLPRMVCPTIFRCPERRGGRGEVAGDLVLIWLADFPRILRPLSGHWATRWGFVAQ